MSTRTFLPAAALLVALGAAACSSGAIPLAQPSNPQSGAPTDAPTATPTPVITGIAHPTGAKDVVLRYDSAGGFVPPEFLAARVPFFTLYGDGRIVFVRTNAELPGGDIGVGQPIRTAVLTEEQIQSLLEFALTDGGLAAARDSYMNPMIADAPTAGFTVNADNDSKTVSAMGLGADPQPGPDTQILKRLNGLAERLRDFDQGGAIASDPYEPAAIRGVITDATGVQAVPVRAWPWTDIKPTDFAFPNDPSALQQATAVLTPEQVGSLNVEGSSNGITGGIWVRDEAKKLYSLVIRRPAARQGAVGGQEALAAGQLASAKRSPA